jgi:hypothetical protein
MEIVAVAAFFLPPRSVVLHIVLALHGRGYYARYGSLEFDLLAHVGYPSNGNMSRGLVLI